MYFSIIALGLAQIAMACSVTLPNIQFMVKINDTTPPPVQVFNVPLFDNDCFYQVPAKPLKSDGQFILSKAISANFVLDTFMDITGNSLDQDSLSAMSSFIGGYLGTGTEIDVQSIFDLGLVVCSIEASSGSRTILGGYSTNMVRYEDQISVQSYQCCIDYNGDKCGFS